ncbi:hypothetical protein A2U01_0118994, partial [Trifolium medium]|nr:hypothetical protein [Trifolium medium]
MKFSGENLCCFVAAPPAASSPPLSFLNHREDNLPLDLRTSALISP